MEKSWVMSEQQRREMMEQRQKQRRKVVEQHQGGGSEAASSVGLTVPIVAALPVASTSSCFIDPGSSLLLPILVADPCLRLDLDDYKLPADMTEEIKLIEDNYRQSYNANPYKSGGSAGGATGVFDTWMQFCKKIGHFFSLFTDFSSLSENDQRVLLTPAVTSAGIIMGSVTFDSWMGKEKPPGANAPIIPKLSFENIERLVPGDLLYRVKTFFRKFRAICPDEAMAKILILVSLYSPELPGLKDDHRVQELQDHYINMLECYIKYKYRSGAGHKFAKSLVSLADVRELAERSLELELNRSVPTDLATASSDPSSGGNNNEFQGSGGGSFGGPSSSGGGGGSGLNDAAAGGGLGDLRGRGPSSEGGGNSNSSGGCMDTFTFICSAPNSFFHPDLENSNLGPSDLFGSLNKAAAFSQNLSMETEDQSDFANFKCPAKEMHIFSSTEPKSQYHAKLTQRQQSDLRIQELFKTIPPPAIMKIIHLMADDLDIEAKKTESGIKFLRKHGSSFGTEKSLKCAGTRRKSNTSLGVTVDTAGHSSMPFTSRAYMDVDIKEEQMDYDGSEENEFNTIKMMVGNVLVSPIGGEPVSVVSSSNSSMSSLNQRQRPSAVSADSLTTQGNSLLNQESTEASNGHHNAGLPSNPFQFQQNHCHRGDIFSSHRRNHFGRNCANDSYRSGNTSHREPSGENQQQQNRPSLSPARLRLGPVSGDSPVHATAPSNDSSLAVVPCSRNLRQQQRRGNGCLTVQLPNSFSSSSATLSLLMPTDVPSHVLPDVPSRTMDPSCSSPHVHNSVFAVGGDPYLSGASEVLPTVFQPTSSGRYGSSIPASQQTLTLASSDCQSVEGDGSFRAQTSPSPPSSYPSPGEGSLIQTASHTCVQKQIMALSIQSPGSPNDKNNGSFSINTGEQTFGSHSREYSNFSVHHQQPTRPSCQQQAYHSLPQHQQQPSHALVAPLSSTHTGIGVVSCDSSFLSNYHQQNKDYFLSTRDNNSLDAVTPTTLHAFTSMTPSPSPSVTSANCSSSSSNSSPEDSTDSFDRSLYTSPINLSGLSDVESAVLQKFFEHINTHFTEPMLEGKHWNTEVLLPKSFLAMLRAKLKTEHK